MEDQNTIIRNMAEKEETLKALRADVHALEAKRRPISQRLSAVIDEEIKLKQSDPEGKLPEVQTEKKRLQQEMKVTFAESQKLHEELYRGDKELIGMEDAFLRARHADRQTRAIEALRLIFEAPHYPEGSSLEEKRTALLQHLSHANTSVPLYIYERDLLERHAWGIDDVILHDFQTLLETDPVAAIESLSHVKGSSDVDEANEMLAMAVDAWEEFKKHPDNNG